MNLRAYNPIYGCQPYIKLERRDITPEEAGLLLNNNDPMNRDVEIEVVKNFEAAIRAWSTPITIDTNGMLRDGQHRMHALVRSGITVNMLVLTLEV